MVKEGKQIEGKRSEGGKQKNKMEEKGRRIK